MSSRLLFALFLIPGLLPDILFAQTGNVKAQNEKSDNDPTKVTTQVGLSWSDNDDFDDSDVTFSGSLAFDPTRKINVRVNSDVNE
jgi:hypothetical protein